MVKKTKATNENLTTVEPVQSQPETPNKNSIFQKEGELVCDIYETPAEFVVMSAIAGVVIKDIDISIEKDMMVIRGERKDPNQIEGKKYLYQECYWGPFSKKVILPENIDAEEASAEMDKGVLTIKFPIVAKNGNGKEKVNVKSA